MIALGKLLSEIYVLLRSGNYLRRTETFLVSWVPDTGFQGSDTVYRRHLVFKNKEAFLGTTYN